MIDHLKADYPVAVMCKTLGVSRSSYYIAHNAKQGDKALLDAIDQVLMKWPYYGYRRVTHELKRKGYQVGETRIRRLLRQIEHSCSVGRAPISTTNSQHEHPRYPNLIKCLNIDQLNQVWVADITYIRFRRKFIYLAVILDAYSRGVRGWSLGRNMNKGLTKDALALAFICISCSEIHYLIKVGSMPPQTIQRCCLAQS